VVFLALTEPPAANAMAMAAALTLSGISVMTTTSYSPNAKNALVDASAEFFDRPAHSFDTVLGIGNEPRPGFRRVAHLTEVCGMVSSSTLRGSWRGQWPRKRKLAGDWGNYAPEKNEFRKQKIVEYFP